MASHAQAAFAVEAAPRSRRVDFEKLRQRAPDFVAAYERFSQWLVENAMSLCLWKARGGAASDGDHDGRRLHIGLDLGHRPIQMDATLYTDRELNMAKAVRATRPRGGSRSRTRGRRAGWVRKNVVMDQRKLDAARRALGVDTETDAIDLALDFVAFRREIAKGIAGTDIARKLRGGQQAWPSFCLRYAQ